MKKLLIGLTLLSSLSGFAVELTESHIDKYIFWVNVSVSEYGFKESCQKLELALNSKQGKSLAEEVRGDAEKFLDSSCDKSEKLSDDDIKGLISSVKWIPSDSDCRNLDFALQSDKSSYVSGNVISYGQEVLDINCD